LPIHNATSDGFDDDETQLQRVPFHATTAEDFAAGLVKDQIRREEERQKALQTLIDTLDLKDIPANFDKMVREAARGIQAAEQLALAQHVVRRKLALELLEKLIRQLRTRQEKEDDHHLEKTFHSFSGIRPRQRPPSPLKPLWMRQRINNPRVGRP